MLSSNYTHLLLTSLRTSLSDHKTFTNKYIFNVSSKKRMKLIFSV